MNSFIISNGETEIEAILNEANNPVAIIVIAHGAGAGMHHHFMENLANAFGSKSICCLRFNFPYMTLGKKFPGSPKPNILVWKSLVEWTEKHSDLPLFLGGKSYGGRMASHLLAETEFSSVKGIAYFGFPLHAPGKDSIERSNHLVHLKVPQLFLQGSRDALAKIDLIRRVQNRMKDTTLIEIEGGDHSFKVKGVSSEEMTDHLASVCVDWMIKLT